MNGAPPFLPGRAAEPLIAHNAGDVILLGWIVADRVPLSKRRIAARHADRLARRHDLGRITVRWFGQHVGDAPAFTAPPALERGTMPGGVAPDTMPGTIGLAQHLPPSEIAWTVAHEIAHLIQRRDGIAPDERACDRFANAYLEERA